LVGGLGGPALLEALVAGILVLGRLRARLSCLLLFVLGVGPGGSVSIIDPSCTGPSVCKLGR
jgi:hypothetical protein